MYHRGFTVCLVLAIGLSLTAEGTPLKKSDLPYDLGMEDMKFLMNYFDGRYATKDELNSNPDKIKDELKAYMEKKYATKAEMAGRKCEMGSFGCKDGCNGVDSDTGVEKGRTETPVTFEHAFKEKPTVIVATKKIWRHGYDKWGRGYDLYAEHVSRDGFKGVIEIIDTTHIYEIDAVWIACKFD